MFLTQKFETKKPRMNNCEPYLKVSPCIFTAVPKTSAIRADTARDKNMARDLQVGRELLELAINEANRNRNESNKGQKTKIVTTCPSSLTALHASNAEFVIASLVFSAERPRCSLNPWTLA